jgi:hypothetical protein
LGREHEIKVRLDDDELADLDAMRNGVSRAAFVRSLVRKPPKVSDVADRAESLAILTAMARDGKVTAAIALARELSGQEVETSGEVTNARCSTRSWRRRRAHDSAAAKAGREARQGPRTAFALQQPPRLEAPKIFTANGRVTGYELEDARSASRAWSSLKRAVRAPRRDGADSTAQNGGQGVRRHLCEGTGGAPVLMAEAPRVR